MIHVETCTRCGRPAHPRETDDRGRCEDCRPFWDFETWRVPDGLRVTWWTGHPVEGKDGPDGEPAWPVDSPHPEATLDYHPRWGWTVVSGPAVPQEILDSINHSISPDD